MKRQLISKYVLAAALGAALGVLPYIADLSHSSLYPGKLEYIWLPGLFLAWIAFPQGVHAGSGTQAFVPLAVCLNVLFYCVLGWAAIGCTRAKHSS